MSKFYVERDKETTLSIFNKRMVYDYASQNAEYTNLVNFNLGEKILYGKVSRNFVPLYLDSSSNQIRTLQSSNNVKALNFVADMFERLSLQFDKAIITGNIKSNEPFLSSLKAFKGYQDPFQIYTSHLNTYFNSLGKELKKVRYNNIEHFMTTLEGLLSETLRIYPITLSGFVKSKMCPISVSGLSIEIANSEYFNDHKKIEQFINSPNWLFYLNACRSYGFMVDKLVPWRLVADIGTSECLEYSRNYNLVTTDQVLSLSYNRTDLFFFNKLKYYLINLYNNNINTYTENYDCNGIPRTRYIERSKIDVNLFDSIISEQRLLRLYMMIRMMEEDKVLSDSEKIKMVNDTLGIYRIRGLSIALNRFEKIINQPFDSSGSLSYLYDAQRKRQEEP